MPNVQQLLEKRVTAAIRAAFPDAADSPALVLPAQDPRFGDYQANGVMGLAKRLGKNPREVAGRIVEQLKEDAEVAEMAEAPEIAGPGFINFRLKADWVAEQLGNVNRVEPDGEDRLGVEPADQPETVVVDYSAPNLAKEMHVGHLRSTIIGDALVRMLDFAGHTVIRQNHVGDWGTQFGMLIADIYDSLEKQESQDAQQALNAYTLGRIEEFYQHAKRKFDTDARFAEQARRITRELQIGPDLEDEASYGQRMAYRNHWKALTRMTMGHCEAVYRRLGVLLTNHDIRGESAYNDHLPQVISELKTKRLLKESEGAQCVFLNKHEAWYNRFLLWVRRWILRKSPGGKPIFVGKKGEPLPLIVQKSDEGYLYTTTDLAAIRYRVGELGADRILYVVDARQSLHFQMVFAVARAAGFAPPDVALEHVAFGTMMGPDGKPFKTREGGTVKLMDLLGEAEKRAYDLVTAKNAEDVAAGRAESLTEDQRNRIAHKVGIGAVKYGDLSQNRSSDYRFDWDQMLSLAGNTAPYMQYAYARIRSIFRKGEHDEAETQQDASPIPMAEPAEVALGKTLLRFPETLDRALEDYRPNILAAYLFDLAQTFTSFYEACPVLKSPEPVRADRLKLCDLVARTVRKGLDLLGIEVADRM